MPVVAVAALSGLGDVLDGSAAEPHDRGIALLSALALPFVLLGTTIRAPLLADGPPPAIGVLAVIAALVIFAMQALVRASVAVPTVRAALPRQVTVCYLASPSRRGTSELPCQMRAGR